MAKLGTLSITLVAVTNPILRGLKKAGDAIKKFAKSTLSVGQMVGLSFGGAAAIGGIKKMMTEMDKIGKSARNLNITTKEYQKLDFAAQRSSVSSDLVFQALRRVTTEGAKAATGSAESARAFDLLGISMEEIKKLSPGDLFDLVALKLNNATDKTSRNRAAVQLLGEQYAQLNNFLGDYKGLGNELEASGAIIPDSAIAAAEKFGDAMTNISTILTAIATKMGLFEKLAEGADNIAAWADGTMDREIEALNQQRDQQRVFNSRAEAYDAIYRYIASQTSNPATLLMVKFAKDNWINKEGAGSHYTRKGINLIDSTARVLGLDAMAGSTTHDVVTVTTTFGADKAYRVNQGGVWKSVNYDPDRMDNINKLGRMRQQMLIDYYNGLGMTEYANILANDYAPGEFTKREYSALIAQIQKGIDVNKLAEAEAQKQKMEADRAAQATANRDNAIAKMEADFAAKQLAKENPAQAFIDAFVAKNGAITEEQRTRLLALFGRMNPAKVEAVAEITKEKEFGTAGDFSAANLARQLGGSIQERIAKATEKTAEETEKMAQYVTGGGSLLTYQ